MAVAVRVRAFVLALLLAPFSLPALPRKHSRQGGAAPHPADESSKDY